MRALLLLALLVALPLAAGLPTTDTRDVTANHVHPTKCPTYSTPATVGCFEAPAGATLAHVVAAPAVGNAQPRMLVWAYNGTQLLATRWMCDDGHVGAPGVTQLVVALQADREGCFDSRHPVIARGTLSVTWS